MLPELPLSSDTLTPEDNLPIPPVYPDDVSQQVSDRGRRLLAYLDGGLGLAGAAQDYLIVSFSLLKLRIGPMDQRLIADFVASVHSSDADEIVSITIGDSPVIPSNSLVLDTLYLIPHTLSEDFARFLRLCSFVERLPSHHRDSSGRIPLSVVSESSLWKAELQVVAVPDNLSSSAGSQFAPVVFPVPYRSDFSKAICFEAPFGMDIIQVRFLPDEALKLASSGEPHPSVDPEFRRCLQSTHSQALRLARKSLAKLSHLLSSESSGPKLIVP